MSNEQTYPRYLYPFDPSAWKPENTEWMAKRKEQWRNIMENDYLGSLNPTQLKNHKQYFFYGKLDTDRDMRRFNIVNQIWFYPEDIDDVKKTREIILSCIHKNQLTLGVSTRAPLTGNVAISNNKTQLISSLIYPPSYNEMVIDITTMAEKSGPVEFEYKLSTHGFLLVTLGEYSGIFSQNYELTYSEYILDLFFEFIQNTNEPEEVVKKCFTFFGNLSKYKLGVHEKSDRKDYFYNLFVDFFENKVNHQAIKDEYQKVMSQSLD